ncbi:DICT sensory domain-containing protein [Dactylosporangium sp. NPDC051541]|uniref:DICT sensory domain-containing protein n=1 Tax=Dactylosporangium sp. NPDC051541 TaxID=3363977 RepID=UPI00379564B6
MSRSGQRPVPMTKRALVTVSHAIERAALFAADDAPMVVFGLFQRWAYFDRERAVYTKIAAQADATIVAGVGLDHAAPPGDLVAVALADDDPLAREWSVVILTPRFGAVLVARDLEQVSAAPTLEAGRLFDAAWWFRRDEALHEVARLRRVLGSRLPQATTAAIDGVLNRARELPSTAGELRAEAAIRLLAERLERRPAPAPVPSGRDDEQTQDLTEQRAAQRWLGDTGTTAAGTLPLALLGIRLQHAHELSPRLGRRAETIAAIEVVRAATAVLRPVDRAVRLDADDLLLIMPALPHDEAVAVANRLTEDIARLRGTHPFIPRTTCAVLVTRDRPLPLDQLRAGLDWSAAQQIPVATLGDSEARP